MFQAQVAPGSFTHTTHESAVYYLFTAYTERAFLHPFRLFKHPLKGKAAARMSRWYKGIASHAIQQVSVRLSAIATQVNAAYTSQTDNRHGVLLGTRSGDQFHCFDKVVLQADYNAARNILARGYDAEITLYMKFTDVKFILLRRTEQFHEQRLRDRAKTLDGYKGEQLSLFDITSSHSESVV